MNNTTNKTPLTLVISILVVGLMGCAVVFPSARQPARPVDTAIAAEAVAMPTGPKLNHAIHIENGLECGECHTLDAAGEPEFPTLELCQECHEDIDEELPDEQKVANAYFSPEGTPVWSPELAAYDGEILFSHKGHVEKVQCADCHGTMESTARVVGMPFDMDQCMDCHAQRQAANDCRTCHQLIDSNTRPPSHTGSWDWFHGTAARTMAQRDEGRCSTCHTQQNYCVDCHKVTEPRSHRHLWKERHGQLARMRGRQGEESCRMCHTRPNFCEDCHQDEPPRSHTHSFRIRTHGVLASIDRESCKTCHTTDYCVRCHETTSPRSHRASWAAGRSVHCAQCHFPVTSNPSCRLCHRSNPTHDTAPNRPGIHPPGLNCRVCHNLAGGGGAKPLKHYDSGVACLFCHN